MCVEKKCQLNKKKVSKIVDFSKKMCYNISTKQTNKKI